MEVYDLSADTNSILGNISTRSFVQTGDNVMIGGFIVQGTATKESDCARHWSRALHLHIMFPMHWLIRHWSCTMALGL